MASYQDLLDAIARVRAATGQDDGWMAGLSPEDLAVVATPVSVIAPGAIDNVMNKIRAQHGSVFEPSAGEGAAAEAIRTAETSLAGQNSLSAQVDLQVVTAVLNAHTTHAAGRGALEDLQRDIESAVRTRTDLDTPAGARAFQRYLIDKLRDIRAVVETVGLDSTSKASLAAALASLYAAATPATADADAAATEPRGEPVEFRPPATVPAAAPTGPPAQGPAAVPADDPLLDQLLAEDPGLAPADLPASAPVPASPMMPTTPTMPAVPAIPSFGAGAGSPTGMPGGAGLLPSSSLGPEPAQPDPIGPLGGDEPPDPALDPLSEPDEPETGEPEPDEPADEPADEPESSVVHLPGGDTVTAPSPQLAAAVTAVLAGTPVAEAYHRQGITVAAPGTPVTHPVEPARLLTGDIGLFTDHHVVALGNGKAVVNGSIEPIASVNGPSFLGWEHPPEPASPSPTPKSDRPTPTRPAVTAGPS